MNLMFNISLIKGFHDVQITIKNYEEMESIDICILSDCFHINDLCELVNISNGHFQFLLPDLVFI
jgi:hypothetical protein